MKLKKKTWIIISSCVTVVCIILAVAFTISSYKLEITEDELQSRISAKIPYVHEVDWKIPLTIKKVKGRAEVTEANISLQEGNMKLEIRANAQGFKQDIDFYCTALGELRYESGKFYFQPHDIQSKTTNKGKSILDFDIIFRTAMNFYLNNAPVYKLPDDVKGGLITALLNDVYVYNGVLVAEISLVKLAKSALVFLLAGILSLGLALAFVNGADFTVRFIDLV